MLETVETTHLNAALAGDQREFERLVEPYRHELQVHCYRILGSIQDAEDMVQETMLRAWQKLETYAGKASFRAWLYKIATNACLDALKKGVKRNLPPNTLPAADPQQPFSPMMVEPIWLEPLPDALLASVDVGTASPESRYSQRESISLAFMVALQALPPRQRAVLIMRDVLAWRAREVAELLDMTVSAANSALFRARATLGESYQSGIPDTIGEHPTDSETRTLLDRYVVAWETANIDELVFLLKEEAAFAMPPSPSWYSGKEAIATLFASQLLAGDAYGRWRLQPTRANNQHAFGFYRRDKSAGVYHPFGIQVLNLEGDQIARITHFLHQGLFPHISLPERVI